MPSSPPRFRSFIVIWAGQIVSLVGSAMSWFAFTIWAWETTGEATTLAMVSFFAYGPTLLLSPLAGALVDRWNRKLVLALSDLATGVGTLAVLILYVSGQLEVWHIYVIAVIAGAFQSFQFPAYSAAVTMMIPKEHYARAEGMLGLAASMSGILGPFLGATFLSIVGFASVMVLDILTFLFAIGTLLLIHIPEPVQTKVEPGTKHSLWQDMLFGFRYIFEHPSFLGLQAVIAAGTLLDSIGYTLMAPMILARTTGNNMALGTVESAGAIGAVFGGGLLIVWGGPKRRIHGVLLGWAMASLFGWVLMGFGGVLTVWAVASLLSGFFSPFIEGSEQSIWQTKVPPSVQGRVFATRHVLSEATAPFGMLLAGPLADWVFEPAMMPGGDLAPIFGGLIGTGAGAGMALILIIVGILGIIVNLGGYVFHQVRNIEELLPDHLQQDGCPTEVGA